MKMKMLKFVVVLLVCLASQMTLHGNESLEVVVAPGGPALSVDVNAGNERVADITWIDLIVRGGNVKIKDLPIHFATAGDRETHIKKILLTTESGSVIAETGILTRKVAEISPFADGYLATFSNLDQTVGIGTNRWMIKAVFSNLPAEKITLGFQLGRMKEVSSHASGEKITPKVDPSSFFLFVLNKIPYSGALDRNLAIGSEGGDVKFLQNILNADPETQIASEGAGSPGKETSYFDKNMEVAMIKFQEKHGLPAFGFVGPVTRDYINNHSELVPQVRIKSVTYEAQLGLLFVVRLKASVVPSKSYRLQATTDFLTWQNIGSPLKSEDFAFNDQVGLISLTQYGEKAFFRLVEKP